jgi:hypothetical protein
LKTSFGFGPLENPIQNLWKEYAGSVPSLLVLRSVLNEAGGFDENLGVSEDRDLVFRLSFLTKFCFVSAPLVIVDRMPDVHRLTGLLSRKDDRAFGRIELAVKKMLDHPKLLDGEIGAAIQAQFIALYYGWTREKIGDLKLTVVLRNMRKIRGQGQGYYEISWKLLSSAGRKLLRGLRA